mgnify:CR=1 FL=1
MSNARMLSLAGATIASAIAIGLGVWSLSTGRGNVPVAWVAIVAGGLGVVSSVIAVILLSGRRM